VAPDTFSVLDRTVEDVLTTRRGTWLTLGLALALWQVGSVVRAAGTALNALYGDEEDRPWLQRVRGSLLLAALVLPAWVLALALATVGGEAIGSLDLGLLGGVLWVLRWVVVAALLGLVLWLVLRVAPARRRPVHLVSRGAVLVVVGWVVTTVGYGVYATEIASYGSVFGALAVVVVMTTWVWLLALVFLGGAAVDRLAA
jgi:membrane protein